MAMVKPGMSYLDCMEIHARFIVPSFGSIANLCSRLKHAVHDAAMKTKFQCRLTSALSTLSEAAGTKVGVCV